MTPPTEPIDRIAAALDRHDRLAIAVSGGVDSMTLAHVAHRRAGADLRVVHAVSPAVPAAATARVRRHAERRGWALIEIDAGEFADPRYRANPLDRCYFCKVNLYDRIAEVTRRPIASGTNRDDLGDFRPGLRAAGERHVVHPFVEAGIGKSDIYAVARSFGLDDLAELPAQPCLASRIETGIRVERDDLALVERIEAELAGRLPLASAIRCRVTHAGIVVECAPLPEPEEQSEIAARIASLVQAAGRAFAGIRSYRRGSAFLHPASP
jgi:uncharacterized protein